MNHTVTVHIHLGLARWWRPAWTIYSLVARTAFRFGLLSKHTMMQGARRLVKRALQGGSHVVREAG